MLTHLSTRPPPSESDEFISEKPRPNRSEPFLNCPAALLRFGVGHSDDRRALAGAHAGDCGSGKVPQAVTGDRGFADRDRYLRLIKAVIRGALEGKAIP